MSRFGSGISFFWFFVLNAMPAGQAVSRFGSGVFFLHGMPAGQAVSRFGSGTLFFTRDACRAGRV